MEIFFYYQFNFSRKFIVNFRILNFKNCYSRNVFIYLNVYKRKNRGIFLTRDNWIIKLIRNIFVRNHNANSFYSAII